MADPVAVNPTDPHDPTALADQDHWKFVNGRWVYTTQSATANGGNIGNAAVGNFWNPSEQGSGNFLMDSYLHGNPLMQHVIQGAADKDAETENTPGANVDNTNSLAERARMSGLMSQLQNQAQTGNGAWQQQLANSTRQANNAAMALGQSMPGVNRLSSQRAAANAIGANGQRAVGQGNILRAQTQQNAQGQLDQLLSGQGQQDVQESTADAAAKQAAREMRESMRAKSKKEFVDTVNGGVQASTAVATAALSHGGPVPGRPKTFGDDEKNDTVPAWLSPGEIVIPRSIARSPNAPEEAAAFIKALHVRGGNHFADGGQASDATNDVNGAPQSRLASVFNPLFRADYTAKHQAPYASGAKLNTHEFDENRTNTLSNVDALTRSAAGQGPTTAPQQMQNTTDAGLAAALQARAGGHGMGAAAAGGNAISTGAQSIQLGAGDAASQAAKEQSAGVDATTRALLSQRQRDMAMAQAQQQAAFRDQQINNGISLADQALMRSIIGGAGQASVGIANMLGKAGDGVDFDANSYGQAAKLSEDDGFNTAGNADDWSTDGLFDASPMGDYDVGAGGNAAHGGEISARRALSGRNFAEGGKVSKQVEPDRIPMRAWGTGDPFAKPFGSADVLPPEEPSFLDALRSMWAQGQQNQAAGNPNLLGYVGELGGKAAGAGRSVRDSALAALSGVIAPDAFSTATARPMRKPRDAQEEDEAEGFSSDVKPKKMADGGYAGPSLSDLLAGSDVAKMDIGAPSETLGAFSPQQGVSDMKTPPPGWVMDADGVISMPFASPDMGGAGGGPAGAPIDWKGQALPDRGQGATGGPSTPYVSAPPVSVVEPNGVDAPPPGVVAGAAPPATSIAASIAPASAPPLRIPGDPALAAIAESTRLGTAATDADTLIKTKVAEDEAKARVAQANIYEAEALKKADFDRRATGRADEAMRNVLAAHDALGKIDTSIDPGRYWASRSTGGKIAGIIGLALGAIGAGNDGINRAAGMMTQAIDRDIDAQKAQTEIKLRKGQAAVSGAQGVYSMTLSQLGDERAALAASQAAAYQKAANEVSNAAAKYASPMAQAQGMAVKAKLMDLAAQRYNDARGHTLEAIKMQQAGAGGGPGAVERKDLREAEAKTATMNQTLDELGGLIKGTNFVTEKVGSKAARMESIAGNLLLQIKDAEKLGTLDKGSVEFAEKLIGDPSATFTLDSSKLAKLKAIADQANRKLANMKGVQ